MNWIVYHIWVHFVVCYAFGDFYTIEYFSLDDLSNLDSVEHKVDSIVGEGITDQSNVT
jgi:hypothetical protein